MRPEADSRDTDQTGQAWQLSADPMRTWVGDGRGGQFRSVMGVLVHRQSAFCLGMEIGHEGESAFDVAGRVLAKALGRLGPGARVQVRDPELATALRRRDELEGIEFEVVDRLEAVDFMMSQMERDLFPQRLSPLLDEKGMSVDRVAAYADACAMFYAARPWKQLLDQDLIEIESPKPPSGMRIASILGAGGEVMGIGFFPTAKAYDRLVERPGTGQLLGKGGRWSLMFFDPGESPIEDADLWAEHGLRVSGDDAIPMLLHYRGAGKVDRPDAGRLTFVEGLCRAIAQTTDAEMDAGRWEKEVQTFDGPVTYHLSMPHMLDPLPAIGEDESLDVKARAMDLCYAAAQSPARRALQLIRQALRLDPDCADAYVLLARRESDPAESEKLYRQGVEAGRRALGEAAFREKGYPFWLDVDSRPFMRAMAGLADTLMMQGRLDETCGVLAEMLRLNPGDNQGMRYMYVPLLIATGRLAEARGVLEKYRGDVCVLWDFAGALVAFKEGRQKDADRMLKSAMKQNALTGMLIVEPELMRGGPPAAWSPGTDSEAVMVADLIGHVWLADKGATRWLDDAVDVAFPPEPKKAKPRGRKKRK